ASRVLTKPLPIRIDRTGADAGSPVSFGDGNLQHRSDPFAHLSMTIGVRETAIPDMVRPRDIRKNWSAIVHLKIAVIHAAHVFFTENESLAWPRTIQDLIYFNVGVSCIVIGPGCLVSVQVPHLAVHGIASDPLPIV